MQVFQSLEALPPPGSAPLALVIGSFDGVHRAHQTLIGEAARRSSAIAGKLAILTFRNHPREVVAPGSKPPLLTRWDDKLELLKQFEPAMIIGLKFTPEFAATEAEDFVRNVIARQLSARQVACGPGFHFGRGRAGNAALLRELGPQLGYDFHEQQPVMHAGEKISSTRIRAALAAGQPELAEAMLGRPHFNHGVVVRGDQLGRTIGFPTANLQIEEEMLVPADGVYAVLAQLPSGETLPAMMNIGWRPTVGGKDHRKEVHILDFEGQLEGQPLRVSYVERLRGEKKFNGLEELKAQLAEDRQQTESCLRSLMK